jgi:hypothetical protein
MMEIEKITEYLDKIAAKLGVGVEHVWPWFVKEQYVEVIIPAFFFIFFSTIGLFMFRYMATHWDPYKNLRHSGSNYTIDTYSIHDKEHEVGWFIVLAFVCFCALFAMLNFMIELSGIFNPEYHALKALMETIK